jgi:predicted DNA-binding transcriptional regulator AlpA
MTANDRETITIQDRRSLDGRAPRRLPSEGDQPPTATERDTTMKHSERLLTITEVAERLNVPVGTMRWRRHLGLPPHPIKVGRNLRYPEGEVDACIEALFEIERKRRNDNLCGRGRPVSRSIGPGKEVRTDVGAPG